jgi:hypothetical protein
MKLRRLMQLPVEDKSLPRAALCVTAKLGCQCPSWVKSVLDDQGGWSGYFRCTPQS